MRLKIDLKCLILSSLFVAFASCNDDSEDFNYVSSGDNSGIIDVDTLVVNEDAKFKISTQLNGTDKIVAVSESGSSIYLDWGYEFLGTNEDGSFQKNENVAYAKVVFDDKWQYGKWNIYVENGNERKSLGSIMMVIVKTKSHKPLITDDSFAGLLEVAADGWAEGLDSIEYYNTETQTVEYKVASSFVNSNANFDYQQIQFDYNTLESGNYDVRVHRWNYNFIQKLGNFDYFRNGLVDTLDITTYTKPDRPEMAGRYYIEFYLDKVIEGDAITVVYDTGKTSKYDEDLSTSFYDSDNRIYTSFIPENKEKPGKSYSVTLKRNGKNITFAGSKLFPEVSE